MRALLYWAFYTYIIGVKSLKAEAVFRAFPKNREIKGAITVSVLQLEAQAFPCQLLNKQPFCHSTMTGKAMQPLTAGH